VACVRHLLTAFSIALGLMWPGPAWSHAYLIRSLPAARAAVAHAPERVHLWFNERLEPVYSRVSVWNGAAQRVDADDARVTESEPTELSVSVPMLPAGSYTVRYRVLSVDGHVVESEFAFSVRGAP
jgi:methionine-rich copper-binding protein CopC